MLPESDDSCSTELIFTRHKYYTYIYSYYMGRGWMYMWHVELCGPSSACVCC